MPTSKRILTVPEVARFLRVNPKTIYEAIRRNELPGVRRLGGTIRILRDALVDWLAAGGTGSPRNSR